MAFTPPTERKEKKPTLEPTEKVAQVKKLAEQKFTRVEIARMMQQDGMFKTKFWRDTFTDAQIKAKQNPSEALKAWRDKQRNVPLLPPKDAKRRAKIEAQGLEAWLKEYFPEWFPMPFSPDHKTLINAIETRLRQGGLSAIAFPRGAGKTTIMKGATIYAVAMGLRRYVVPIMATGPLAASFLSDIKKQFMSNEWLIAQYPEVCRPAALCEDNAQRASAMMFDGKSLGFVWKKNEIVCPHYPKARSAGAIIHPAGITASMRGLQKSVETASGSTEILRPDFILIDDPQTKESAKSAVQTRTREETITGDILGLAGPNTQISGFMTTTVIMPGDLADKFLDPAIHPEWNGVRVAMIKEWPKEQEGMWKEYAQMRREGMSKGDEGAQATAFYRANRVKMDEGSTMSWDERKHSHELSALQHAENLLIDRGESAFWSEYQNQPRPYEFEMYEITPKLITHRLNGLKRHELDPMVRTIAAFTDINFAALRWAVVGFKNDRSAFVLDYGQIPERGTLITRNTTIAAQRQLIASGLHTWFQKLTTLEFNRNGVPVQIRAAGVDRGFMPDVVHSVCRAARLPFAVIPAKGYAGTQYHPTEKNIIGKAGHYCHLTESQYGQFLASNTDYYKEMVQRGFLAAPGAPGSVSLWGDHAERHIEFAEQVAAESLTDKAEGARGTFWKWSLKPGACNDWFDAVTGCFSLGAWFLGGPAVEATGRPQQKRAKKKEVIRKPTVRIEE